MTTTLSKILAHIRLHRITTEAAVARLFCGEKPDASRELLGRLADAGDIFRHVRRDDVYYTLSEKKLTDGQLIDASGILWFCCMTRPRRLLLLRAELRRTVAELAASVHVEDTCYVDRSDRRERVSLLRVNHHLTIDAVEKFLRQLVAHESFAPWRSFVEVDRFTLTYLMGSMAGVAAMRERFQVSPLCTTMEGVQRPLPIHFRRVRLLGFGLSGPTASEVV